MTKAVRGGRAKRARRRDAVAAPASPRTGTTGRDLRPASPRAGTTGRDLRPASPGKRRYVVTAVARALGILENVDGGVRGTGITELSRRLGLGKSTVHRLCATLEHHGYLVRDPGTGRYRLSLRVFQIGSHALDALELPARAMPALEALGAATEETVHLAVLDGADVIFIGKVESPRPLRLYSQVGRRCPAHCTAVGKILLAYAGAEQRAFAAARPLKRYTPNTLTSAPALDREFDEVRRRGYATDEEEFEEGIRCIAGPVRDYRGRVVAAVSVSVPAGRLPRTRTASLVEQVLDTARLVSEALGHRGAPDGRDRKAPA
ncbi:MAG TPA: IclR family transcriptional regulator [bacterium]|nr:IclR family transcriptional regulator [bacterium]